MKAPGYVSKLMYKQGLSRNAKKGKEQSDIKIKIYSGSEILDICLIGIALIWSSCCCEIVVLFLHVSTYIPDNWKSKYLKYTFIHSLCKL